MIFVTQGLNSKVKQCGSILGQAAGGSAALWTPANGAFESIYQFFDSASVTLSASNITDIANTGSDGGSASQALAANQPVIVPAALNGFDVAQFNSLGVASSLALPDLTFPAGWAIFVVLKGTAVAGDCVVMGTTTAGGSADRIPSGTFGSGTAGWIRVNTAFNPVGVTKRQNGTDSAITTRGQGFSLINTTKWESLVVNNITTTPNQQSLGANGLGQAFTGFIAALVIKKSNFTLDETQRLEGWAAHKFAGDMLTDLDPASPYKSSPPVV